MVKLAEIQYYTHRSAACLLDGTGVTHTLTAYVTSVFTCYYLLHLGMLS